MKDMSVNSAVKKMTLLFYESFKSVLKELLSKIKSKCTQYFNVSGNFALTYILAIFFGHIITFLFFSSFFKLIQRINFEK